MQSFRGNSGAGGGDCRDSSGWQKKELATHYPALHQDRLKYICGLRLLVTRWINGWCQKQRGVRGPKRLAKPEKGNAFAGR